MNRLTRGALGEFIGTLLFVLVGAGTIVAAKGYVAVAPLLVATAQGLALAMVVTCFMPISGGQINPAVSVGLVLAERQSPKVAAVFIVAQLLGAACGAGLLRALLPGDMANDAGARLGATIGTLTESDYILGVVGIEAVCTFFLMSSVMLGMVDERAQKLGGLPVGLTYAACFLFAGVYTGGSMNPARSFGPAVCGRHWDMHWAYWVGPLLGASIAALLYKSVWQRPGRDVVAVEVTEIRM
jgi:MIP family channel proteins